ncbi:NADH-ubiquinone oxidoreductase-F iron-sulfur binding region domain-containing protein [Nocardiopsis suaedae]|uniref:NAD(P)H-dependent oxidoreductase subunit E n=1 Tax=Nocardiopsis suaedae TaxID=3018444 RepID=A0ABT4TK37_9ACTN|nr:NADH-ubiquinone oxidoreductase-F iron-sulfur binding region domain-containing protein [Nocardiopsis suaedae]MDA2805082.1 NAD(P)H-dependent oxidoreductase subunit E [Nocardiopsis suaedae]
MDLQHLDTPPSDAERAAVDALLGPPGSAWEGGERTGADLRRADGGQAARGRRDLLLPALHAVNDRIGWISEGALGYICRRLTVPPADAYGVASFYSMFALHERPKRVLHVCTDIACAAKGSGPICRTLEERLGAPGHGADPSPNGSPDNGPRPDGHSGSEVAWVESPCLGMCERAPAALAIEAGDPPGYAVSAPADPDVLCAPPKARPAGADAAPAPSSNGHRPEAHPTTFSPEALAPMPAEPSAEAAVPQAGDPGLLLLGRIGAVDPTDLDSYRAAGGYTALRRAIALGPSGVIREVTDSGLVGRGGAAFPTGRKWAGTAQRPEAPRYLVCNADESEPGTFKDRVLMEGDPFSVIEAMTVAGFAIGAARGYLYIRGEYPLALSRLENAITRARARGLLGEDILGSGFSFDIEIRRGAGAYICGEETAIFNSIEGLRGEPRSKPPFPVERGLFDRPTAANNVETLVNVLPIVQMGGPAYARIGTGSSTGPKLFCVSGTVARPGVYEVPFGATLRDLLGLANAGAESPPEPRAVLLGGAAGGFLRGDELDVPLTFEGAREAGTTLGSGVVLVLDDTVDLPAVLVRIAAFFRDESCGQCVPCRVGTVRQEEALARLSGGTGDGADIALLRDVGAAMRDASICGLGQTAWNAVESAIDRLGVFADVPQRRTLPLTTAAPSTTKEAP